MRQYLAPLLATSLLAACAVGPTYQAPPAPVSGNFHGAAVLDAAAPCDWWQGFHDAALSVALRRSLAQNLDLAVAAARIGEARAQAESAGARLLPRADAVATVSRESDSLNTPFGAVTEVLPGASRGYETYSLGAEASWEIDLFGGLRRGREAAVAAAQSAEASQSAVRLATQAEVADAYLALRGLQARLGVAQALEDTESHLVELVHLQVGQGIAAERDLNRARADLEAVRASMPPLRAAIDAQVNRLDVLMGEQAGADDGGLATPAALPTAPAPAGSVVVSDLMRRRPDVVAAERRVAQSNALIGAALAEYYPRISLSALAGVAAVPPGALLTANSVQAQGLLGVRWRLFDFGRVDAEVAHARAGHAEVLAQYRATVLRASEEVEDALSAYAQGGHEVSLLQAEVTDLAAARDQAQSAYRNGVLSLIDVLDVQRKLLDASDRLAQAQADQARSAVAAYRALGGGWTG